MSVCIRLSRVGTNKKPFYRVVAAAKIKPRDGRYLEVLGSYDPKAKEKGFQLKRDRFDYWVSRGAQPTQRVADLVSKGGGYGRG